MERERPLRHGLARLESSLRATSAQGYGLCSNRTRLPSAWPGRKWAVHILGTLSFLPLNICGALRADLFAQSRFETWSAQSALSRHGLQEICEEAVL